MSTNRSVSNVGEFQPDNESISAYLERVSLFFEVNGIEAGKQVAWLLNMIGAKNYSLVRTLVAPEEPKSKTWEQLTAVLKQHYEPKRLVIARRFYFHRRDQDTNESIAEYVAELRKLAAPCEFGDYLNEALRDRFVCGLRRESTQKRLLSEVDLSLSNAVSIAQSMEAAESEAHTLRSEKMAVHKLESEKSSRTIVTLPPKKACHRCGKNNHLADNCFYKEAICNKCKKKGHLAKVCRSANPHSGQQSQEKPVRRTQWVERSPTPDDELPLYCLGSHSSKPIIVEVELNGTLVSMEVDTGAAVSLMSQAVQERLFPQATLQATTTNLRTYTGEAMKVIGKLPVTATYANQSKALTLYIVPGHGPTLLGREWLQHIKLDWKSIAMVSKDPLQQLLDKHASIFEDTLGTIKDYTATLKVKEPALPKFYRPRPVPFAVREAVGSELDRLEKLGILEKVEHSQWAAPIVPVPKSNGQFRICGDYKSTVNDALEVDQYPLPKPDDLFTALTGGQKFTVLDLSQAYQQMKLNDESKKYVTVNTHQGLYCYTRLPFGIASAPAIFQRTMDSILQGMPQVLCYIDDILITGKTDNDHLQNLSQVLTRLEQQGIRLKKEKCKFMAASVEYLGHKVDANGIHTSDRKVEAVQQAPIPKNTQQLKSFLGLVHYYGKFIPHLSALLHPLNQLLKANTTWFWSDSCEQAFQEAKQKLASAPVLVHYDPSLPLRLAGDASQYGIGAVISQVGPNGDEQPVAYASRTLSTPEKNYSQIEKEALSLIFGLRKFHQYLYARNFTIVTDHKPLLAILGPKKNIPALAAARMQRWALLLSAHNYKLEYRPTQAHGNADGLSRLPVAQVSAGQHSQSSSESSIYNVCQVEYLPVTVMQLQRTMQHDPVLSKVLHYTKYGWPAHLTPSNKDLKPFWDRRLELTTEGQCLLWGTRVIIPNKLYSTVLDELHTGHPGIVRMKAIARSYVWWPGLDKAIENQVKSCKPCQTVKQSPPKAPLHPWVWPMNPWERIHVDFAGPFLHKMFMIVMDAHSKWPEVIEMPETTSGTTIKELRKLFASYGLPRQVVTDNGPQFTSNEFSVFMKSNGVKHIKCSPYHPSSNGAAERFVQTFKRSIKAAEQLGKSVSQKICEFLLSYRNTPHVTTKETPSMLFLKRQLRTRLDLLRPDIQATVHDTQDQQKKYHDTRTKPRYLSIGTPVMAKNFTSSPKWCSGMVIACVAPLTYLVQLQDGRIWRRHVDHIVMTENQAANASTRAKQDYYGQSCEDWSYGVDTPSNSLPSNNQAVPQAQSEGTHRYPTRTHRPPQRLIEQTDL